MQQLKHLEMKTAVKAGDECRLKHLHVVPFDNNDPLGGQRGLLNTGG